jgi:hypothetical protein
MTRGRRTALLGAALLGGVAALALAPRRSVVPRWMKAGCGGFLGVLIPVYWRAYGPGNFLWLSDLALFATVASAVTERPEPAGAAAGVLPLELSWCADFAIGGRFGLADYMFDAELPTGLRALSLFHLALPPTLLWLLKRLGYDRRSLRRQALVVAVILPASRLLTPRERNVNWAYSLGPIAGSALITALLLPMHAALTRAFPPAVSSRVQSPLREPARRGSDPGRGASERRSSAGR